MTAGRRVLLLAVAVAAACRPGAAPPEAPAGAPATAPQTMPATPRPRPSAQGTDLLPRVELRSPAGPGSLAPQLATGPSGRVVLSWIEPRGEGHAVRVSELGADGWSAPSTVTSGDRLFVNWADTPAVLPLGAAGIAVTWLERTGEQPYAYGVRLAVSSDRGASWGEPVAPHADASPTEHGFVSLVPWPDGGLGIAWLDGREMLAGGPMGLRFARMMASGRIEGETLLDPRTCDCCPTAAAWHGEDLLVAYRDRTEDETRDIALVRRTSGTFTAPERANADGWTIPGCPVNGPALAADGARVALAWFTAAGEQPRVLLANSPTEADAAGPVRVDGGEPIGRAAVALLPGGRTAVGWLEHEGEGASFRIRLVDAAGRPGPIAFAERVAGGRASGYPRMVEVAGGLILAWTAEGGGVRTVRLDVG